MIKFKPATLNTLRFSLFVNFVTLSFLFWYFGIHIGFSRYYNNYFNSKERFFENVYYKAKVNSYTYLNKLLLSEIRYDVFVGDSHVEQFPALELFNKNNTLNRGIGHDTTIGLKRRLADNVTNINIGKCFLWIGYNDLKYRNAEETAINIAELIDNITAEEKYVISIIPCYDSRYNKNIAYTNSILSFLSENRDFEYVDAYSFFIDENNEIIDKYFLDGIHLNIYGYTKLHNIIVDALQTEKKRNSYSLKSFRKKHRSIM